MVHGQMDETITSQENILVWNCSSYFGLKYFLFKNTLK
jgi:hypothetical protein